MSGTNSPQGGLTRRSFLKTTAAVAGATALAGGAGLTALADDAASPASEDQTFYNVCPVNCGFAARCSIKTFVRDGKLVKVAANDDKVRIPADLADSVYFNRRACHRGRSHVQWVYGEDRIKYPMRRMEGTERGAGEWERVSWEEAIDEIAGKFVELQQKYGKQCVFGVSMTGNGSTVQGQSGAFARFMNAIEGTNVDYCLDWAIFYGEGRVTGAGGAGINFPDTYVKSKAIFNWGSNVTESAIQFWTCIDKAKKAGAKLITIDPRYSTSASKSDLWVPIKIGTDLALANAMIKFIIDEHLINEPYVMQRTCAPFLVREDNGLYLRMSDLGQAVEGDPIVVWDAGAAAPASYLACVDPALRGTFEVNGIKATTAYDKLAECVADCTLEWAAAETGLDASLIEELARTYADGPCYISIGYGHDKYDNGDVIYHAFATLASITGAYGVAGGGMGNPYTPMLYRVVATSAAALPDGRTASTFPWLQLGEIVATGKYKGEDYPLKAMINMSGNPVSNMTNKGRLINEILPKLELIVTLETRMTDTALYSDIVLPACHFTETYDYCDYTWTAINEKAIEPLYEAKDDMQIGRLITEAMGLHDSFPEDTLSFVKELLDSHPSAKDFGLTYDDLSREKVILNLADSAHSLLSFENLQFFTASGRLEFYCEKPAPRMDYGQEFPVERNRLPRYCTPMEVYEGNPLKEKYPLAMWQEHTRWRIHTTYGRIPWLRELDPEPVVKLSPQDAAARGISTGDVAKVFNDRGYVVLKAVVDASLPAGMCNVPKGWERDQFIEGDYQDLTPDYCNPSSVNQSYYDVLVEIQKVN